MMAAEFESTGTEEAIDRATAVLGEHFQHYAIVVQYDDGTVWHQGNNDLVEKALYQEALNMIQEERDYENEDLEIDWEEEEEAGDDWLPGPDGE